MAQGIVVTEKPAYFETIRANASRRWDQLERDPELAGPWHLLFKQVQSPRHILSELLQNADDAGASAASVRIEEGVFLFEHNGEDFTAEHFASLCRFGYSNKRGLHTIGFRGIGFKSTFSLGGHVDLITPTLAVRFHPVRFTEPCWLPDQELTDGPTLVRVAISDPHRQAEVEKNLKEWLDSPLSLLFFRNIRRIQVGEQVVHWSHLETGPLPESEWVCLDRPGSDRLLILRSEAEPFPQEALAEIKQERMLGLEDDTDFPPCRVEIVLGLQQGRLFVVLPTGVATELPFACNAPFIQDPARLKIKDPETSPTNRWLLERAGKLAASAMFSWLGQSTLSLIERAKAYALFPDVDQEDNSLEGVCGATVVKSFAAAIDNRSLLLTINGQLTPPKMSIILPEELFDIWPEEQVSTLTDDDQRPAFCRYVAEPDCKKLLRWDLIEALDRQNFLHTLSRRRLPRPESWRNLLNLWAYIAPELVRYSYRYTLAPQNFGIVPIQGQNTLHAANEVVRLGDKNLLQSDADWEFLSQYLLVMNPNWPRYLAEQRRTATEREDESLGEKIEAAYDVMRKIGLEDTSSSSKMLERVSVQFFARQELNRQEYVRLAQIAAKLGAAAGSSFRYITKDDRCRPAQETVFFDENGTLEELLPAGKKEQHLLHPDYHRRFSSCTREEWLHWVSSGRSGLLTLPPLTEKYRGIYGTIQVENVVHQRGISGEELSYPYSGDRFQLKDWDYEEIYWQHWESLAQDDERLWLKLGKRLLSQRDSYWTFAKKAELSQIARNGWQKAVRSGPLLPAWALRLRELPCLPDIRGFPHKPGDLLRLTPATASLLEVEPFLDGHLDTEQSRPLLDLLGIRNTPTGPARLIAALRTLAQSANPPAQEVDRWYRRLDQMINTCTTEDFLEIKTAFATEKLILSPNVGWVTSSEVFISASEEDVPGAALVRPSVVDLMLWSKVGIAERPTAELAIQWLKDFTAGQSLSPEDLRRVRALLPRYPLQIWQECGHWLNLLGEWVPGQGLLYAMTMQSLVPWSHLFPRLKQQTADFQRLPSEIAGHPPFSNLPLLASRLEERFHRQPRLIGSPEKREWLIALGAELCRAEFENEEETARISALAARLAKTNWQTAPGLEIIPYIDETPAGTPRRSDLIWLDHFLYVDRLPMAKLAKRIPEEISKPFGRPDIRDALAYSFERPPDAVREYLTANFTLATKPTPMAPKAADHPPGSTDGTAAPPAGPESAAPLGDDTPDIIPPQIPGDPSTVDGPVPEDKDNPARPDHSPGEPKPPKPSIMERFAQARGFRKDISGRYLHANGEWLAKSTNNIFPWERRTAGGDLVCYYWAKDHCLEEKPLPIEAEIWGMIEQLPETCALILATPGGDVIEIIGKRLLALRDDGRITLYPATYRLKYNHERNLQKETD